MENENILEKTDDTNATMKTELVERFLEAEGVETLDQIVDKHEQWLLSQTLPFGKDPRQREMSSISYYGELPKKSDLQAFNGILNKAELTTRNVITALTFFYLPEFSSMEYDPTITIPAIRVLADYEQVREIALRNRRDWYSPMDNNKSSFVDYKPTQEIESSLTFSVNVHWEGCKGNLSTSEGENKEGFDCIYDPKKDVLVINLHSRSFTGWLQDRKAYGNASQASYGLRLAGDLLSNISKAVKSQNIQDKISIKLHRVR